MNSLRLLAKFWRYEAAKCRKVSGRSLVQGTTFAETLNARAETYDTCAKQLEDQLEESLNRRDET